MGEETLDFRPPHDRRHQANVLVGGNLAGFDLSARWTFGSGFPYSRAVGFDGFALIDDIVDVGRIPTSRRVIYERPFSGELPHYHRLDLSLERVFKVGSCRHNCARESAQRLQPSQYLLPGCVYPPACRSTSGDSIIRTEGGAMSPENKSPESGEDKRTI